jgi:uncharacterized protein YhfF
MQLERFSFGDGPAMVDGLLALVLSGAKTATCWAARDGKHTEVGGRMVACDSTGAPRVVLETVALEQKPFDEVDEDFARAEGEGDLTLAWWREAHQAYFERNGGFDPKMQLWCERFHVVRIL